MLNLLAVGPPLWYESLKDEVWAKISGTQQTDQKDFLK